MRNFESILLVVDVMNDFIHPDGAGPIPEKSSAPLLESTRRLIQTFIDNRTEVMLIQDTHTEDDECFRLMNMKRHAIKGSWGWCLPDPLLSFSDLEGLEKKNFSAFFGTDLHAILKRKNIGNVFVCGVYTDVCVMTTCIDAHQHGYSVKVVEDCTDSLTEQRRSNGLGIIKTLCGADSVIILDSVESALSSVAV